MQIVSLQNFDGSWSPTADLSKILQTKENHLKVKYKVTFPLKIQKRTVLICGVWVAFLY